MTVNDKGAPRAFPNIGPTTGLLDLSLTPRLQATQDPTSSTPAVLLRAASINAAFSSGTSANEPTLSAPSFCWPHPTGGLKDTLDSPPILPRTPICTGPAALSTTTDLSPQMSGPPADSPRSALMTPEAQLTGHPVPRLGMSSAECDAILYSPERSLSLVATLPPPPCLLLNDIHRESLRLFTSLSSANVEISGTDGATTCEVDTGTNGSTKRSKPVQPSGGVLPATVGPSQQSELVGPLPRSLSGPGHHLYTPATLSSTSQLQQKSTGPPHPVEPRLASRLKLTHTPPFSP
jgi:hypothetical protein